LPAAGFELTADDGEIIATAELAWESLLTAVLIEYEWEGRAKFEERGWKVFRAGSVLESNLELFAVIPGAKS
jgi:hypothetical protein